MISRVIDYPFASRQSRLDAYRYCVDLKSALLDDFTDILNSYHRTNHSRRYWDVLLCGWLHRMVMIAFHHFQCLETARARFPKLRIFGPRAECTPVPETCAALYRELYSSYRHLAMFAELADEMAIPCERVMSSEPDRPVISAFAAARNGCRRRGGGIRKSLRGFAAGMLDRFAMRADSILYNATPDVLESIQLAISSRGRIARLSLRSTTQVKWPQADMAWRRSLVSELRKRTCRSGFPAALAAVLSRTLPVCSLEGLAELRDYVSGQFPRRTRAVISGMAWHGDDAFSLWAAERSEQGGRLISTQHGGSYGIREMLSGSELVESEIVDKFLSWGNAISVGAKTSPVPMLPHFYLRRRSSGDGRLLYLGGTGGLLLPWGFVSGVDGPDAVDYTDRQRKFFAALPGRIARDFLVRLNPIHLGWNEKARLQREFPDIEFDDCSVGFMQRLREARLAVVDNMNTTYQQTIGSNIPTILVWDPEKWGLNAQATKEFDRLRSAGVFYDDPAAAAKAVVSIATDPMAWWTSGPVAEAVGHFTRCYLKRDKAWVEAWREQLQP